MSPDEGRISRLLNASGIPGDDKRSSLYNRVLNLILKYKSLSCEEKDDEELVTISPVGEELVSGEEEDSEIDEMDKAIKECNRELASINIRIGGSCENG